VPAPGKFIVARSGALAALPRCRNAAPTVVEALGWQEGLGFLTHEGVITAAGFCEHLDVVPDPLLVNRAPYRYGFATPTRRWRRSASC